MKRPDYFDKIEKRLNNLACRINARGKINLLDLNTHSEAFFQHFLKKLYGWDVTNANSTKVNTEAIDLIDHKNKIVVQISATNSKQKIEKSLSKDLIKKYNNYTFKFVSISKDCDNLKKHNFKNPHNIIFSPKDDIIDKNSILTFIKNMDIDKLESVAVFIEKELAEDSDITRVKSNLAHIINVLAKEDWDKTEDAQEVNSYEIERKIKYNNLLDAVSIINQYSMHYGALDRIYNDFDKLGNNKSSSVFAAIIKEYLKSKGKITDDKLFFDVLEKVIDRIRKSSNYVEIPYEELEICVNILVVDAFIRCKIFDNPKQYNYATS